jgi:O-antigen ligase
MVMPEKKNQLGWVLITYGWAGLAVALMLLGRWTPDRLFADATTGEFFWLAKVALLLALALLVALPGRGANRDRRAPGLGIFVFLVAYLLASYLWNPSPILYADTKIADVSYNLALVLIVALGLCRATLRQAFWIMLVAALGVMALIGVATIPAAVASYDQGRLSVLGGGPNVFGRNMGVLMILCLYFGVNNARVRVVCAGLAGAAAIGLIASGSRGSLGATLVALAALFVLDPGCRRFALKRPLFMATFALMGVGVLALADLGAVAEIGSRRFFEQTLQGGYLSERDVLIIYSYHFWLEAPLFGNGLGSFSLVTPVNYPHNILMELLCETGLVGLVLFLLFAFFSLTSQYALGGRGRALLLPLIALVGISSLASGDFADSRFLFLFMLFPVGVLGSGLNWPSSQRLRR